MKLIDEGIEMDEFIDLINNEEKLIILDFFAEWCRPCNVLTPYLKTMETIYTNVLFLKIDVDKNPDISQQFNIKCMPTIIFLKNKSIKDKIEGQSLTLHMKDKINYEELDRVEGIDTETIKNLIEKFK